VLVQYIPHIVCPKLHAHVPPTHDCPRVHALPHIPQWNGSTFVNTHAPSHIMNPAPHEPVHPPSAQTCE
jgi:hypothetical protein